MLSNLKSEICNRSFPDPGRWTLNSELSTLNSGLLISRHLSLITRSLTSPCLVPGRSHAKWLLRLTPFLVVLAGLILYHAALLTALGKLWTVDETLTKADAIVVLGGGVQTRPFAAAKLYREGFAPKVIVINVERSPTDQMGLTLPESQLITDVLLREGVPGDAITLVGENVSSTYEEALAVSDWLKQTGARHLLVPTESFHTRRVNWIFKKVLHSIGTDVQVKAVEPGSYHYTDWWQTEKGLIEFQNEVIKFAYYLIKF